MSQTVGTRASSYRARDTRREAISARGVATGAVLLIVAGCNGGPLAVFSPLDPISTGSLPPVPTVSVGPIDRPHFDSALAEALDPQGHGATVSWRNPETRISGSVAPLAAPSVEGDLVCRPFVSVVTPTVGAEATRYEGRACRLAASVWRVEEARRVDGAASAPQT